MTQLVREEGGFWIKNSLTLELKILTTRLYWVYKETNHTAKINIHVQIWSPLYLRKQLVLAMYCQSLCHVDGISQGRACPLSHFLCSNSHGAMLTSRGFLCVATSEHWKDNRSRFRWWKYWLWGQVSSVSSSRRPPRDWTCVLVALALHFTQRNLQPSANPQCSLEQFHFLCPSKQMARTVFPTIEKTFFLPFLACKNEGMENGNSLGQAEGRCLMQTLQTLHTLRHAQSQQQQDSRDEGDQRFVSHENRGGDLIKFHFHAFPLRDHGSTFRLITEDTGTNTISQTDCKSEEQWYPN